MNKLNKNYRSLLIIGLVGYIFIAFIQTGLVPRYALAFMTISLIPMAKVYFDVKNNYLILSKYYKFNFFYYSSMFLLFAIYLLIKIS